MDVINQKFEKIEYNLTDLRNSALSTDHYVDSFLPFNIMKQVGQYLKKLLN